MRVIYHTRCHTSRDMCPDGERDRERPTANCNTAVLQRLFFFFKQTGDSPSEEKWA